MSSKPTKDLWPFWLALCAIGAAALVATAASWAPFLRGISFDGATFAGGMNEFSDIEYVGARVTYHAARFVSGVTYFNRSNLREVKINFRRARFSSGEVAFEHVRFGGATLNFYGAYFEGANVYFDRSEIYAGQLDMSQATIIDGCMPRFDRVIGIEHVSLPETNTASPADQHLGG